MLIGLGGCVVETHSAAPERQKPRSTAPPKPAGIRPEQMTFSAGVAMDSDGNGFRDTIPVVVYLFGDTRRYPLPLQAPGVFEFELIGADGARIGEWIFNEEETARSVGDSAAGVCYRFALRLGPGRDRMSSRHASLRAIFINRDGGYQVTSPGAATIRLGAGE